MANEQQPADQPQRHYTGQDFRAAGSNPQATSDAGTPTSQSSRPAHSIRRVIEFCGEHPFATGLFALLSVAGLGLAAVDFGITRAEERSTNEQLGTVEAAVRELPTAEQVDQIKSAVDEVGERVGSTYRGGVFLFEEPVEGLYFNEWWAHPITSDKEIERYGQADVTIRGEGKTVEFSGVMSMNCENGKYYWRSLQNFLSPVTAEQADQLVPQQIRRNVYRLFCRDR